MATPTKEEIKKEAEHEIDYPGHPDYGKKIYTFSESKLQEYAELYHKEKLRGELINFRESFVKTDGILISDMDIDDYLKSKE